jgi:hypothetical protein
MADRICLRLGRRDMNTFRTVEREGKLPVVHVAGRHAIALCPTSRTLRQRRMARAGGR